jgi:hypothetical protein
MAQEPQYTVTEDLGDGVEVRKYAKQVWACTVSSSVDDAFMRLATYFSGANSGDTKIPVTAPVISRTVKEGLMTAFVLPQGFDADKAPVPLNKDIGIRTVEERKLATIAFSGYTSPEDYERNLSILSNILRKKGIKTAEGPFLFQYNDPWTPPLDRRNEVAYVVRA